ncbi:MAG: hypothetical protein K8I00_08915, partial [Candidatus Omnitrophica bacterium]|nr:hypothetical protein [Candidatus Omnitrophota bacterium]
STPATLSHGTSVTTGTLYMAAFRATNGTNSGADLRLNGDQDTVATFDMTSLGAEFSIGSDYSSAATEPFDGEIAEVIVYSSKLSDLNIRKVESYLAVKYGITLDQTSGTSYLSASCTTTACTGVGEVEIWDAGASGASTYDNDIAVIGKDNASEQNQTKSRSINSDSIVTVSAASDLEDVEFFSWGNDDGSTSAFSTEVPVSGLPSNANVRLTREWLAQNNGGDGVGTVSVTFDLAAQTALKDTSTAGDYALLIDTDGDFTNATIHTTGASFNGSEITFTTADIDSGGDGLYFTLAGPGVDSPGDVSGNLQLWLKASTGRYTDTGCSTVAADTDVVGCWADQSSQGNHLTEGTAADQPAVNDPADDEHFNFNPTLEFDGSDHLTRATLLGANDDITLFIVFSPTNSVALTAVVHFSGTNWNPLMYFTGGFIRLLNIASNPNTLLHTATIANNVVYSTYFTAPNVANGGVDWSINGDIDTSATYDMITLAANFSIGATYSAATTFPLTGDIAEVIVYDANLTGVDIERVDSYLAIKYGVTLDQTSARSYLSSNCTTTACNGGGEVEMWDSGASGASTYDNDIAGIGKDAASGLNQTKSKSVNTDSMVTISAASDLEDLEFFTWGNDNGAVDT